MPPADAGPVGHLAPPSPPGRLGMLRLFLREQHDPVPYYEQLAARTVSALDRPLAGARVVDLGCGPGHFTRALRRAGAHVIPVDLDVGELLLPGGPPGGEVVADGAQLPLHSATVDGVFSSNTLEHTPRPAALLDELARVLRPGGWAWLSWTVWLSPFGGHEVSPFHYLGPRLATRIYRRRTGRFPKNRPGESLFPLHVGPTLRLVRRHPAFRLVDAVPRYYPSQRWLLRVPGLREVATWNCLVVVERR